MNKATDLIRRIRDDETGHLEVGGPSLVAAVGAIVLAIGAASDTDWVTITGGVILGVGLFLTGLARHRFFDYDIWRRLDKLEK
jgi:hypothetical protein